MPRTLSLLLLLVTLVGCSSQPQSAKKPTKADREKLVTQAAPDFTLKDINGGSFTLSQEKGKVVLLDFWATWCPPCQMSIPELKKLDETYSARGLEVVSISLDDRMDKVEKVVAKEGLKHRQLFAGDADAPAKYAVRGIPMFVLIDKQGNVVKIWTGFSDEIAADWRKEIDSLLK